MDKNLTVWLDKIIYQLTMNHFLDILLDLDMADPPDLIDIEPLEDIKSTELGALL